jgi:8-oxo-dGTP diphosphatase
MSRFAGVLAFHEGRVVLVREQYPAWGGQFWNVPSGRVEDGESFAQGAARELAEETGLGSHWSFDL